MKSRKQEDEYGSTVNLVGNMAKNEDKPGTTPPKSPMTNISFVKKEDVNVIKAEVLPEPVEERVLTPDEKSYLLCVERGDVATAKATVEALKSRPQIFDINCVDPLGRSGLIIAVENENIDMIEMLLSYNIKPKDALLVAIREEFVDGTEMLLRHEEESHVEGEAYSWESLDNCTANFTSDITPVILAAHKNNYEILKLLLDRGATIPIPHDVKCSCEECVTGSAEDSLKFSLARINAYKALASPSLIALSAKDPILSSFQLSDELKRLAKAESQYREEYVKLRKQVQEFVTGLIDHTRTSFELETILNHNPDGDPWQCGDIQTLERLKLSIHYKQKTFVAHPSVQQLLAAIWYEGLPGFRRKNVVRQLVDVFKLACCFPINSFLYILAPHSEKGKFMRNPFVKFISHSASYMFFLMLLALASQRAEYMVLSFVCFVFPEIEFLQEIKENWIKYERGSIPHPVELLVILWVNGYVWVEMKALWKDGLLEYMKDMWNLADIFCIGAFMNWIGFRALSFLIVQKEIWDGKDPDEIWKPREDWDTFEPMLLADAMFGAGMIASYLKVVHIFSINPYLGPLQIAIGKMILDIIKWMFLYILVVFAFGCGMNQLMWYYADLERQQCYQLPGGLPDFDNEPDSCTAWRRFANLWETSQSLFWASFGLVELGDFDMQGIGEFTRFWGLLMFGSYSCCNIIVLLNMLIAMMSNSYQIIFSRSDTEWKFSRSKLWISYFDAGSTVPVPFNLIPAPKTIFRILCCRKGAHKTFTDDERKEAETRYNNVMRFIIRRYITNEQRKSEDFSITEDDINEVRQDINSFKFELLDILKKNNWVVPNQKRGGGVLGRKSKNMERQIQKGFQITKIEGIMEAFFGNSIDMSDAKPKDLFKKIARAAANKEKGKDWRTRESIKRSSIKRDQIGSTHTSIRRQQNSLKKSMLKRGSSQTEINMMLTRLNSEELVAFNPLLTDHTPATRRAYAIFKSALKTYDEKYDQTSKKSENKKASNYHTEDQAERNLKNAKTARDSIKKLVTEKQRSIDRKVESPQATVNKSAADLEKVLDEDKSKDKIQKDVIKSSPKPKTKEDLNVDKSKKESKQDEILNEIQITQNSSAEKQDEPKVEKDEGGVDNAGFQSDELIVKVTPPTVQNTLKSEKDKSMEKSPDKNASSQGSKKTSSASLSKKTENDKDAKKDKQPPEDEICWDPEGKSAISGQRRTGWI